MGGGGRRTETWKDSPLVSEAGPAQWSLVGGRCMLQIPKDSLQGRGLLGWALKDA